MGLGKDIFGVGCSAVITGGMFLGAPILGIVWSLLPGDMVDVLAAPERPAVYFDAAYELSDEEIDGDLDGNADEAVEVPEPDDADESESEDGGDDSPGEEDPDSQADRVGGEVDAEPVLDNGAGTRVGSGGGADRKRPGEKLAENRRKKKKSRKQCAKSYDGIRQRPDGTYVIDRELVNYYTASVKHFNELGWSKPNDRGDGKGWFIHGFGCNDPLYHGGFRRGDIVLTVNGKKTNNMMQVLMLYTKVKTKRHFEVVVRRRGKEITLRYNVVKG
jgi:hypothetical protein